MFSSQVNSLKRISEAVEEVEDNLDVDDTIVPLEHRSLVQKLVRENSDLFANKDSELGHTDTVKMKLDTGDHAPIKLRPYRTPLNNRKFIDQAVEECWMQKS